MQPSYAGDFRRAPASRVAVVLRGVLLAAVLGPALMMTEGARASAAVPYQDIGLSGGPLTTIAVGTDLSCQVEHTGDTSFEFYPPAAVPGDCGTFVSLGGTLYAPDFADHDITATDALGDYVPFTAVSQTEPVGAGTATDPRRVTTTVNLGTTGVQLVETDSYIADSEYYDTTISFNNSSGASQNVTLYRAGDCYLQDSDWGYGFSTGDVVGCSASPENSPRGRVEAWTPTTAGATFLEDFYASVWAAIGTQTPFSSTCAQCTTFVDNGAGISWTLSVPPGTSTATRSDSAGFSPNGNLPPTCSAQIAHYSPSSGTVPEAGRPGTTVTITGESFCPGTRVQFGNSSARVQGTVQSPTELTAIVPRNATGTATSGGLQLIAPDGTMGSAVQFPVDTYRNTNGFQFGNDAGIGPDFGDADVIAAFGDNAYATWTTCKGSCAPVRQLSSEAKKVEQLGAGMDGMCFGFALGSLRFSQGLDPRADAAAGRSDPTWLQANDTWGLASYESYPNSDPYRSQMRHYLYAQQIRQYSTQYADAVRAYAQGLKSATDKGAYLLSQVQSAISHGMALIGVTYRFHNSQLFPWILPIKNDSEGHELVAFDVETHSDGSFDIDVYDGNQPWNDSEVTDAGAHAAMLTHNQIHVQANGDWTYNGDFAGPGGENWSGGPDDLQPVPFSAVRGQLSPLASGASSAAIAAGAPVTQVTDAAGRSLFDADGDLVAPAQRADAVVVGVADTNTTTGSTTPPMLLLRSSGRYGVTLGPGDEVMSAGDFDGSITSTRGGQALFAPTAGTLGLTQSAAGQVQLALGRHADGVDNTVSVSGPAKGTLTLSFAQTVSVVSQHAQTIHLTIQQQGTGQPPTTFSTSVRLGALERLLLGPSSQLHAGSRTLNATIIGKRGHRHSVGLVNRAPRPGITITTVAVRHGRATTATVQVSSSRATGGAVVITVAVGGRSRTQQQTAERHVTLKLTLPRTPRRAQVRVWAVAIDRSGQASRTAVHRGLL